MSALEARQGRRATRLACAPPKGAGGASAMPENAMLGPERRRR